MTMPKALPAQEQVPGLPLDQLAMHVLWWHGDQRGSQSRKGFLTQREAEAARARQGLSGITVTSSGSVRGPAAQAWQEAYEWLIHHGLLTADVTQSGDFWMPSRLGLDVARDVQGLARMRASARLDVDLHPSIAGRIGSQFLLGEYELAAFAAMRQVEIRVRELAGASDSDLGVKLMTAAFKTGGPLHDATIDPGESESLMALFRGAIGTFKNPSSHREVDFADPTEASEIVLLADLLLRMLDRIDARINGGPLPSSSPGRRRV